MNINTNYKALLEGRMTKSEFLRQARQGLPQYISNCTSFDDAIRILKQKSILSEELVYQNKADKFPLESIQRGIRYELEEMGIIDVNSPSREEYRKARQKAIDNLCKDSLYYINKIANSTKPKEEESDKMQKVNLKEGKYTGFEKKVEEAATSAEDERKANKYFLELYCKYKEGKYEVLDPNTKEKVAGKALEPAKAAQRACIMVRKAYKIPGFRPDRTTMNSLSVGNYQVVYQGEQEGKPTFNQSWKQSASTRGRGGQISEDEMEEGRKKLNKDSGEGSGVYGQIFRQLKSKYPDKKEHDLKILANKVYANYQKKHGEVNEAGYQPYRGSARGGVEAARAYHKPDEKRNPSFNPEADQVFVQLYTKLANNIDRAYKMTKQRFPSWRPSRDVLKNLGFTWLDPEKGTFTSAHPSWREGKEADIDKMVLKETIINLIGKVINEAATTNLAQLSDENASVAELPAAINNLENIVTEIESFWLKEQQKIQGVFDSLGNIKNEDGLPIGYKFAQPIMDSLKKDLEPVLAKISLESLKLPEAPAPDQTPVNDPNNANPVDDPNAVPEVPEKKTVFSPAEEPLQESKKNRRYTK